MTKLLKQSVIIMLAFIMTIMMSSTMLIAYADDSAGDAWTVEDFVFDDAGTTITGISDAGAAKMAANPDVVIPDGTIGIAASAFKGTAVKTIKFPESGFNTIGLNAFQNCTNLESITIPASVTTIGGGAFVSCTGLKSLVLSDGINLDNGEVPAIATGCTSLETLVLPEGITSIASSAFQRDVSLKNVNFPSTLQEIKRNAFSGNCLVEVDLSGTQVKTIGSGAFSCTGNNGSAGTLFVLASIKLNEGLEKIDNNAFKGTITEKVDLPSTVISMSATAFGQASASGVPETGKTLIIPAEGVDYPEAVARNVPGDKNGHVFQFTVKFDADNEAIPDGKTDAAGKLTTELPTPSSPELCSFDGWFAEGAEEAATADTVFTEDTTLKAKMELHKWDEGKVTTPATEKAEGVKTFTCSLCNKTKTEAIPKLPASANDGQTVTDGQTAKDPSGNTVKVISATAKTAAFTKAANKKSVKVPDTVTVNGETLTVTQIGPKAFTGKKIKTVTVSKNVKKIAKNAFKGSKATKMIVKSKKLKKSSVKGSLKGSKIKTVQVKVGKSKDNKKYVKKYKKIFTKKNAGKKVKIR